MLLHKFCKIYINLNGNWKYVKVEIWYEQPLYVRLSQKSTTNSIHRQITKKNRQVIKIYTNMYKMYFIGRLLFRQQVGTLLTKEAELYDSFELPD